jgi:uncharacterized tellurite resistance protein B-like protein
MNAIAAAYNVLYVLSLCDGRADDAEAEVILEFLQDNYDGSFDPDAEAEAVLVATDEKRRARLAQAAGVLLGEADPKSLETLLEFGLSLVMTDGELAEEENELLRDLAGIWNIELQPLVARAMDLG